MNISIQNLNLGKVYLDNGIDFVSIKDNKITSIINGQIYDSKNNQIIGLDVIPKTSELHYYKKYKNDKIPPASESEFFLARSLKININDILTKNLEAIAESYKKLLVKVLKAPLKLNIDEITAINNITDEALLLQYLPKNKFQYESLFEVKRIIWLNAVRSLLYDYIFTGKRKFTEHYDRELNWIQACLGFFNLSNFKYLDFDNTNEDIMVILRKKWLGLIEDTYERAKSLLKAEEDEARKFEDNDSVLEIQIIYRTLKEAVEAAELKIELIKTPRELLRYWPEILAPGPVFLHP
jgi:hypothetical protein